MKFKTVILLSFLLLASTVLKSQYFSTVDINAGYAGGFPQNITNFQGVLFMSALDDSNNTNLVATNGFGYEAVTLNPGGSSNPQGFTAYNGNLYFQADDGFRGAELWELNGTSGVLKFFYDINPGSVGSYPNYFTECNNDLFFVADDSTHGYELWFTDGDSVNTRLVKDILPGRSSSNPVYLTVLNNILYFQANDSVHGPELWRSDSTQAGTQMVADINPADTTGSFPAFLTVYNSKIYFQANDGVHGVELWSCDTSGNAQLVSDINPGSSGSFPQNFTVFNGKLYFQAFDTTHGTELWVTDGTNTQLVSDIYPGNGSSNPGNFIVYNGNLYFQATDSAHGSQLWMMNTSQVTTIVSDIYNPPYGSNPRYPVVFSNKLFFVADDSLQGSEMYSYNGIDTPVILVPSDSAYSSPLAATGGFTVFNNVLAFSAQYDSTGQELWFYGSQVLAIPKVATDAGIKIYPNPFSGGFNVSGLNAASNYTFRLLDISGRVVWEQQNKTGGESVYIPSPVVTCGIYLLQIQSGETFICRKLVKTE